MQSKQEPDILFNMHSMNTKVMKMKFINERIYWHGTGRISNCLNRLLQEVLGCAPAIILTIFFCKVKNFLLLEELPPRIIPYFITVHNINTRLKLKLHKPTAGLTKYQGGAYYNSINIYKKSQMILLN